MERHYTKKQLAKLLAIFFIIQIGGMAIAFFLLHTQAPSTISAIQNQGIGKTTTGVYWYVTFIIVIGVLAATAIKFSHHILRHLGSVISWLKTHPNSGLVLGSMLLSMLLFFSNVFITGLAPFLAFLVSLEAILVYSAIFIFFRYLFMLALKFNFWQFPHLAIYFFFMLVGALMGLSFTFQNALVFLVLLAVYDFIAVFITKHMLILGKALIRKPVTSPFAVVVNDVVAVSPADLKPEERRLAMKNRAELSKENAVIGSIDVENKDVVGWKLQSKADNLHIKEIYSESKLPVLTTVLIGAGDIVVSLMASVSAYVSSGIILALYVFLGSFLGISLTLFVLSRAKRGLPAVPFILGGIGLGLLLYVTGGAQLFDVIYLVGAEAFLLYIIF